MTKMENSDVNNACVSVKTNLKNSNEARNGIKDNIVTAVTKNRKEVDQTSTPNTDLKNGNGAKNGVDQASTHNDDLKNGNGAVNGVENNTLTPVTKNGKNVDQASTPNTDLKNGNGTVNGGENNTHTPATKNGNIDTHGVDQASTLNTDLKNGNGAIQGVDLAYNLSTIVKNGNCAVNGVEDKTSLVAVVENGLKEESGCFLCGVKTDLVCDKCGIQTCTLHVDSHKGVSKHDDKEEFCMPFRIVWKEGVGRCVLATRDIQPLEVVLEDKPALTGPNYETHAVCVQCLGGVSGEILCELCNLPFCSQKCKQEYETSITSFKDLADCDLKSVGHHVECAVFSKLNKKMVVSNFTHGTIAYEYGSISVLRLLYLRDNNPEVWTRLQFLMDHDEERRKEEVYWEMFQVNVVKFLRERCGLAKKYSAREIQWAIGILRTNCANLERPNMVATGTSGKVIFPTFSFISHSCICNTRYIVKENDCVDVIAKTHIKKGEEISIQYHTFMFGNLKRRKDIQEAWMFECTCKRCLDTTELGTNLSGMKCQACGDVVLPVSSNIDETDWKCIKCDWSMTTEQVLNTFKELEDKMYDTYETDIEKYETLIEEYSSVMCDNHFQMLILKSNLNNAIVSLGKVKMSQLKQKIEHDQNFLKIFSIVDPGCSSWRAKRLFEISKTRLFLADLQQRGEEIAKDEFLTILKECIKDLEESVDILKYEAVGSKDHKIGKYAQMCLSQMEEKNGAESDLINKSEIKKQRKIGRGSFADVYRGLWTSKDGQKNVALKQFTGEKKREEIEGEMNLRSLKHPNILECFGYSHLEGNFTTVVLELSEDGSLDKWIYDKKQSGVENPNHVDNVLGWFKQCADGLDYMHSQPTPIIHRNIQPKKLLLFNNGVDLKISDMGYARNLDNSMTGAVGTFTYNSPELLSGKPYDEKTDIFSFGISFFEILTCSKPYTDNAKVVKSFFQFTSKMSAGMRPGPLPMEPEAVVQLIKRCWETDTYKRPHMRSVSKDIKSIQEKRR